MSESVAPKPSLAVLMALGNLADQMRAAGTSADEAVNAAKSFEEVHAKPVPPKNRPVPFERSEHLMHHPFAGLRSKVEAAGIQLNDSNSGYSRHNKRENKKAK